MFSIEGGRVWGDGFPMDEEPEKEEVLTDEEKLARFKAELASEDEIEEDEHQFKSRDVIPDHSHGRSTTGL